MIQSRINFKIFRCVTEAKNSKTSAARRLEIDTGELGAESRARNVDGRST